jgi:hypothetical protein
MVKSEPRQSRKGSACPNSKFDKSPLCLLFPALALNSASRINLGPSRPNIRHYSTRNFLGDNPRARGTFAADMNHMCTLAIRKARGETGFILSLAALCTVVASIPTIARAEIIPSNRRITWNPGVPGGIPSRTTIYTTVNADKTGATDAAGAIQSALNSCPVGQVVFIPAGTYRLNSQLYFAKGIVLRGAGPDKTFLNTYANADGIQIGNWPSAPVVTGVSGSPTRGSTSISVSSISSPALATGDYIVIDQKNDNNEVVNVDEFSRDSNTRCMSQITKITGINGTTLSIDPPLYHDYSSALIPQVWKLNQGTSMTINAGLEDISIERISPIAQNGLQNVKLVTCAYSWVKNIHSKLAIFRHVDLDRSFRCTTRDSYFEDGYYQGTGGYSYGVVCGNRSTDQLIENNIFSHLRHSMVVKEGAAGNVFGYNYSFNTYQGDSFLAPDMFVHGAHPVMNLYEGNFATKIDNDDTHGSGSYNTFFRNYVARNSTATTITGGRYAVNIESTHSYPNLVGNVLGQSNLTWTAEETASSRSSGNAYVWSWGFHLDGGTTQVSTKPKDTSLRHGNYSANSRQTSWDASITDHTIPASLYLSSKPPFFGSLPWPLVGPDVNPIVGRLPARERFLNGGIRPGPPTNLRIVAQ